MPFFDKEVLKDTTNKALIKFTFSATGPISAESVTSSIEPSDLTGFTQQVAPNAVDIRINKIFWSLPSGGKSTVLSYGTTENIKGIPFMYLNNSGFINFSSEGLPMKNISTSPTKRGSILLANSSSLTGGEVSTIIMEVDKINGFIPPPPNTQTGYDAKPMVRWDVVPFQTFSGSFQVGVLAFHINGIEKVNFSINNGPWISVSQKTINSITGTLSYNITLNASSYPDGPVNIRAMAIPAGQGLTRTLEGDINNLQIPGEYTLTLYANSGGTLQSPIRYVSLSGSDSNNGLTSGTAKRTVEDAIYSIWLDNGNVDGGIIYLLAGDHIIDGATWPRSQMSNSLRWLTIQPAPGVNRNDVSVKGGGPDVTLGTVRLLRWYNVKIIATTGAEVTTSSHTNARVWYDSIIIDGNDRTLSTANGALGWISWPGGKFITDSTVSNLRDGTTAFQLVRNVTMNGILSDAYSSSSLVINSTVTDINPFTSGAHPDVAQYHGGNFQNVILYKLSSDVNFSYPNDVQGLFLSREGSHTDIAVVDCFIANTPSWSLALSLEGPINNLYMKNTTIHGGAAWGENLSTYNVVFDTVTFLYTPLPTRTGVTYR